MNVFVVVCFLFFIFPSVSSFRPPVPRLRQFASGVARPFRTLIDKAKNRVSSKVDEEKGENRGSFSVVSRVQWDARPSRCCCRTQRPESCNPGVTDDNCCWQGRERIVLHFPGEAVVGNDASQELHQQQLTHMRNKKEGYCDIAYNFAISREGSIYELRGWDVRSGANGKRDSNAKDLAVTVLIASGEEVPEAAITAIRSFLVEARARGWQGALVPHSAIIPTGCPGKAIKKLIEDKVIF